jgi:hypothetical protein
MTQTWDMIPTIRCRLNYEKSAFLIKTHFSLVLYLCFLIAFLYFSFLVLNCNCLFSYREAY